MAQTGRAQYSSLTEIADQIEEVIITPAGDEASRATAGRSNMSSKSARIFGPGPIQDALQTESSKVRDEVLNACLPFLNGNPGRTPLNTKGIPQLLRQEHVEFLQDALERYPKGFVVMDASRPWIFYWALAGLSMLGEDVQQYRERLIYTAAACQNPTGGFGGGHGQLPHIATSYAMVLSLVIVGGQDAYDVIDRKALWHFLSRMKQADGGFTLAPGAEEDIRGAYCAMTMITLLNLPLELAPGSPARVNGDETFLTNLPEWVAQCQSFEGGIGAAPGNEAHGAYAFCALACLSTIGKPSDTIPHYLDTESLTRWLSSQQNAPEGGFAGRTNKLVDGCYSHWVGGCWSLLEAALLDHTSSSKTTQLWSRDSLARWILSCCQGQYGGLRDKPGKSPDSYHSCYILAGLCAAQYRYRYNADDSEFQTSQLSAGFGWHVQNENNGGLLEEQAEPNEDELCWDEKDLLKPVHPVFVVPLGQAEQVRSYFEQKLGF